MRIAGNHALITGGSRGLGPHIARSLADAGADVTLVARDAALLRDVADDISGQTSGSRGSVRWIAADICDTETRAGLLDAAAADLGPVDILVNNAGIESIGEFARLAPDLIETMIQTNLVAPLQLARIALAEMVERGRGHVVTMSSLGGKKGSPYSATYAATKSGLIEWTAAVRQELRGSGIGVSVVVPGFVSDVGMFADRKEPAPRMLKTSTPEAVAAAVVRAVEDDVAEIIVNPGPKRLLQIANAVSPDFVSWVLAKTGVYDYYRRRAELEQPGRTSPRSGA